jgi:signal transduction histidine kinase
MTTGSIGGSARLPKTNKVPLNLKKIQEGDERLFFKVIENAGGVPFQLLFGQNIGDGQYLKIGEGIHDLLGIQPEDFTEKLFNEMILEVHPLTPDLPTDSREARKKFLNGEIPSYKADILIYTNEKRKKWIRDTSLPMYDEESGKVIGAFGILNDIQGNNRAEFQESSAGRSEESERLKAAFLQNISHEIRTPLNAIVGFSTLLSEQIPVTDSRREYLNVIARSSDHLAEIIDDIVEISKIETGTVRINNETVNLNSLLRKVFDRYCHTAAEKGIMLVFALMPDQCVSNIITDSYKISQVLRYLVGNAVKFTNKGKVEFGYEFKEGTIEFYVSDTGIGIPEEFRDNLFRRFYQVENNASRNYEGTGLGLAISKAYIELLGGRIWYEPKPMKGSIFRFTIPDERAAEDIVELLKRERK